MVKRLGLMLAALLIAGSVPAKADTFQYTLAYSGESTIATFPTGSVWTWTLTSIPTYAPSCSGSPTFPPCVGTAPPDVLVSYDGQTPFPNAMSLSGNSLSFECDPYYNCGSGNTLWDLAFGVGFLSSTPLTSGSNLLAGTFDGGLLSTDGLTTLVVTDTTVPEPSTFYLVGLGLLGLLALSRKVTFAKSAEEIAG